LLRDLDRDRWRLYETIALQENLKMQIADHYEQTSQLKMKFGNKVIDWAQTHPNDLCVDMRLPQKSCLLRLPVLSRWIKRRYQRTLVKNLKSQEIPLKEMGFELPSLENIDWILKAFEELRGCNKILADASALEQQLDALPGSENALIHLMALNQRIMEYSQDLFKELPSVLDELTEFEKQEMVEFKGSVSVLDSKDASGAFQLQTRKLWSRAMPVIMKHFPLWAVTNLSAASRLPFQPGMFDYVIIDEASVCDIPSALPLLARAKRAVIVGDPAQLQHVTKISVDRERDILIRNNLLKNGIGRFTHRENSLYHLAASASKSSPHLLREHYRCHEQIADYFNQTFYGGRLRVRTDNSRLIAPPGISPGIHWTDVQGPVVPAKSGCYAPNEIDSILIYLNELLEKNQFKGTLGVVTAFREQATRLMDRISDAITPQKINEANLGAYTAHQFQGDARDVIVVSLCAGPDIPAGSLSFLSSTANLMNVAVSRAKAVCHVFGNLDYAKGCGIPHIVALADAYEKNTMSETVLTKFESPWEERLYEALLRKGITPIPQYPLAGRRLDLAIIRGGIKLDVEIDGETYHRNPDGTRKSSDLWRNHQIRSLGWGIKRFWVYQLRENMEACVDDIFRSLES
jgi:very-short-patch-repair endonuclease